MPDKAGIICYANISKKATNAFVLIKSLIIHKYSVYTDIVTDVNVAVHDR